jgi:2Fe-2S ferredoxin
LIEVLIENLPSVVIKGPKGKRLLDLILENGVDYMHACGGKGRCTTCKAIIVQGMEHLGTDTPAEARFRAAGRLGDREVLACQRIPESTVRMRVAQENYMPHLQYSNPPV